MHLKDLFSKQCCLATVGFCMIGFGALFSVFWMDFFERTLAKEMHLAPNSRSFEMWKTPPIPMSIDIYLFNWTNPTPFDETFEKPILVELGPYRFTEVMDKVDVVWSPHNSTVSYRRKSTYFFDAAGSRGQLGDTVTTLNIIALSAAAKAMSWSYVNKKAVSVGLKIYNQLGHVTKTAGELLFDGYQDDMIDMAREMPSFLGDESVQVPFDRFGWFYMRNGTSNLTGHYNMNTGAADIAKIGKVESWDYQTRTSFFPGACGQINGSAGEFYPPHQTKDRPLSFYSSDMCRTLDFDFERERSVRDIVGYKYSGGRKTVDNGTAFPANQCFSAGEAVPSGVMNVTSCRYGTPVFMSFPHYYAADPYYLSQVDGLRPDVDKHEFSMTLEPSTGIPLDVAARLQINMLVRPTPDIALYENAPRLFFPVLWFEQRVSMGEEMAAEIRMLLAMPQIGYYCCVAVVALGVVLVVWLPLVRAAMRCCGCRSRSNGSSAKISGIASKPGNGHKGSRTASMVDAFAVNVHGSDVHKVSAEEAPLMRGAGDGVDGALVTVSNGDVKFRAAEKGGLV